MKDGLFLKKKALAVGYKTKQNKKTLNDWSLLAIWVTIDLLNVLSYQHPILLRFENESMRET
jgi:hypothetical protein